MFFCFFLCCMFGFVCKADSADEPSSIGVWWARQKGDSTPMKRGSDEHPPGVLFNLIRGSHVQQTTDVPICLDIGSRPGDRTGSWRRCHRRRRWPEPQAAGFESVGWEKPILYQGRLFYTHKSATSWLSEQMNMSSPVKTSSRMKTPCSRMPDFRYIDCSDSQPKRREPRRRTTKQS